jgi:hypothetical protein
MTLGEFRKELNTLGIRQVSKMKRNGDVVISFSTDEKIVFPFPVANMHWLMLSSDSDDEIVNVEIREALKRRLLPNGKT